MGYVRYLYCGCQSMTNMESTSHIRRRQNLKHGTYKEVLNRNEKGAKNATSIYHQIYGLCSAATLDIFSSVTAKKITHRINIFKNKQGHDTILYFKSIRD